MIQIIEENRKPTSAERFAQAFSGIQGAIADYLGMQQQKEREKEKAKKFGEFAEQLTGKKLDWSALTPQQQQAALTQIQREMAQIEKENRQNSFLNELFGTDNKEQQQKQPKGILSPEFEKTQQNNQSPENQPFDVTQIPDEMIVKASVKNPAIARTISHVKDFQSREKSAKEKFEYEKQQDIEKANARKLEEARKETLPIRMQIANKANAARKGIENKKQLMNLINTGKLNDPTFATFVSDLLPYDLGKRLLSPETVQYKAALVDEFSDLRNIFQGQTRVKELEILEAKMADIYFNDDQKKAILNSRIDALQYDLLQEQAAEQVERDFPGLGALQYSKKVDEVAQKLAEPLFNKILDQHEAVIKDAENKKAIPLNPKNPEDLEIMKQIKAEAGGDKEAAKKLAKKKGYSW